MTKTAAAHHDDLIAEIRYELGQYGAQSLIDMIATLVGDLPDPRAEEIASDLEVIAYGLPAGPLRLCDCGATGCVHCDEAMQPELIEGA